MQKTNVWVIAAVVLVVGAFLGYLFGSTQGSVKSYQEGYDKGVAEAEKTKEELAKKSLEEAAKAANPFKATNPLEGINANPFDDAAKKLNPFSE